MKTVRFHETGGPEVLTYEEVPDPTPGPGEILIRVEAAGMNFADVLRRRGDPYPEPSPTPFTLGGEIAGTVAAHGAGVSEPAIGALVYATTRIGGYAQYVVVPAGHAVAIPAGIDAAEATTLVVQGLTAYFALANAARLAPGESVLVEAAAGGVGGFAVQIARLLGAGTVIGAASSAEKRAVSQSLGADASVDYTQAGWAEDVRKLTGGAGVDVVLEMAGGETVGEAIAAMGAFGRMIVYGQASGEAYSLDPQRLVEDNQSITGFYIGGYFAKPDLIRQALDTLIGWIQEGEIRLQVGARFPLSKAADAHRLLEGRGSVGKVVLEPWSD